jgi:hypothetical protein
MKEWFLIGLAIPGGAVVGAVVGWIAVAIILTNAGRDGHGSLYIVFNAALTGSALGAVALPSIVAWDLRRRRSREDLM